MISIKTGEKHTEERYSIIKLGASSEKSESSWALFGISYGDCADCDSNGVCPAKDDGDCKCQKDHVHVWVKEGHYFLVNGQGYLLKETTREKSTLEKSDGHTAGMGDC